MEIELWSGSTKAIVDPRGAWLTNLSDENGDILFPKRTLKNSSGDAKLRGGCHVCLPNFGPGGNSGQPQHGFGREITWNVTDKTDDSILLELPRGSGDYANLRAELSYQLTEHALVVTLDVMNKGDESLRVAPAFHPYFALLGGDEVKLNGELQPLEDVAEAQIFSGETQKLQLPNRTFTLSPENLPVWAKWTDQLGAYVCVEPSSAGFSFLNEAPDEEEILAPAQTKTYALKMAWR